MRAVQNKGGTYYTYSKLYITLCLSLQWNVRMGLYRATGPFSHAVIRVDKQCNETEMLSSLSHHIAHANNSRQLHAICVKDRTGICTLMIKKQASSINTDRRGITCHVVMKKKEKKNRLTPLLLFQTLLFSFSHIYINTSMQHTHTHVSLCKSLHLETADLLVCGSFDGDVKLFCLCITGAARHSQKQDRKKQRGGHVIKLNYIVKKQS